MIRLVDLKRNDVDGSLAYYRQCVDSGTWSADIAQSVATLHDDPDVFYRAVAPPVGRRDSAGRYDLAPAIGKGGKGYNPYRSGGKFASGPHKEKPKGPGRAPGAAAAKPKREKFNAEPHKQVIAAHKALEAHHRGESLRLAGELKALKEQAKATKPRSAERASLKEQHAALKAQRDEHKAKATASRTERIAASKEMQAARKEHAASVGALSGRKTVPERKAREISEHELEAKRDSLDAALSHEERVALAAYAGERTYGAVINHTGVYIPLNQQLRGIKKFSPDEMASLDKMTAHMDSALAKALTTEAVLTYRVASGSLFAKLSPGDHFVDPGFVSTSTEKGFVLDYASSYSHGAPALMSITSPPGTKIGAIRGANDQEHEMLLGRNTALRLDRRETKMINGEAVEVLHMTVTGQH